MTKSEALKIDFSKPQEASEVLPCPLLLSSQMAGWETLNLQVYGPSQAWETPLHAHTKHCLSITLGHGSPAERRLDNQLIEMHIGNPLAAHFFSQGDDQFEKALAEHD